MRWGENALKGLLPGQFIARAEVAMAKVKAAILQF
jgi:hypothetical protein